jgi:3-deoxy-D-manno-octulosonic-acid transferase
MSIAPSAPGSSRPPPSSSATPSSPAPDPRRNSAKPSTTHSLPQNRSRPAPLLRAAYAVAATAAAHLARWTPASQQKWLRALRARSGILDRYTAWGRTGRDRTRPLLWIHAPSVGEGLQARPVLELVRTPSLQIAYTFFSPSAEAFAAQLGVDFADYLPFDTRLAADAALDALAPTALVFSKLDVWPTLVDRAATRGVRLGLISATLAESSGRRHGLARALLTDAYARLDAIGAIDPQDADRLVALGARSETITVTGDTRYDQVWARANASPPRPEGPLTIVAGSTWPSDERVLLPAWRQAAPNTRLVIAPHEPTPRHLAAIEAWARTAGVRHARLDHNDAASADLVVVDRLGVLGDLYGMADIAYVGGAFHAAGLHSTLEPAAFGVPVLFGPRHQGSRDAALLIAAGAAHAVSSVPDLAAKIQAWTRDDRARREAGDAARDVVRQGLGAAQRSATIVGRLLAG